MEEGHGTAELQEDKQDVPCDLERFTNCNSLFCILFPPPNYNLWFSFRILSSPPITTCDYFIRHLLLQPVILSYVYYNL